MDTLLCLKTFFLGTKVRWGTLGSNNIPGYFSPGKPIKRAFPMGGDKWVYSYVTEDDIKFSRDIGGFRCLLVNYGVVVGSAQLMLWQPYKCKYFMTSLQLFILLS